jgi:signal transduction histidine kinase
VLSPRASLRHVRLTTLLAGINVVILALAVTGVAVVALRLLQPLADQQELERVSQASISAQHILGDYGRDLASLAQTLSERPTLQRYVDGDNSTALAAYLDQYRHSSEFDSCAVLVNGRIVAASGTGLPWVAIWQQDSDLAPVAQFLFSQPGGLPLLLGASATIAGDAHTVVLTADLLDASMAKQISAQISLQVKILSRSTALAAVTDPRFALRQRSIAHDRAAAAYFSQLTTYVAVEPIRAPSGQVVGVIEASLAATQMLSTLHQFAQTLLIVAMCVIALAAALGFFVGRQLEHPLRALTMAAARIGGGDLATPVHSAPGSEIGTLALTLEEMRTQLLRSTSDLRRQQAEAEAIIIGIVEGVFTVDRERRIRYLNPQAAALLGIGQKQAIGRFCGDVLNPLRKDGVRPCEEHCPIVHARFRGATRATEHLMLTTGQRRTIVISSSAPTEEQQVQIMRDESGTEATRRLRDTVLANISHEFKTPLSAQQVSIALLLEQLPKLSSEQIGDLVLALQRGTLRLTQLIDNLLESVRIESGSVATRLQPVALDEVIEEAIEMTRPLLHLREQEIVTDLPYPLPMILGDAPRLTQVFVNLLANANKFAPPSSTITIGGEVLASQVSLWVEDQGAGLPAQAGASLFEQFARAAGEEPEQSGMGLGLWIAKSIVDRHNGQIAAERHGGCTRMCVTLPSMEA